MSEGAIDWRAIVDEAIRRRKHDGLSQRDLAALAGVSVPTVNSFEKGEISLRFDRVVAILDALGLFIHPGESSSLQAFAHSARRRWTELVEPLEADDPSRQPFGHSEKAYALDLHDRQISHSELRNILAHAPRTSGWPPFWVPTRSGLRPTIRESLIECWLGRPTVDRAFNDPAHSDFWQVSRGGKAFLQRGYQEDGPELQPGTIFDLTLPIWRTAEVLLHAAWLARTLGGAPSDGILFSARYTGLAGRQLFSWAKPLLALPLGLSETHRARTDSIDLEDHPTIEEVENELEAVTERTLLPLYERFDGFHLPADLVRTQISELRAFQGHSRPGSRRPGSS